MDITQTDLLENSMYNDITITDDVDESSRNQNGDNYDLSTLYDGHASDLDFLHVYNDETHDRDEENLNNTQSSTTSTQNSLNLHLKK